MLRREAVEVEGGVADPASDLGADEEAGGVEVDVLVVLPRFRLGRGGEERFGEPIRLAEIVGQRDSADRAGRPVLAPPRADEVAPDDRLDGKGTETAHDHRAPPCLGELPGVREHRLDRRRPCTVVAGDRVRPAEPELGDPGQHRPLAGDRVR